MRSTLRTWNFTVFGDMARVSAIKGRLVVIEGVAAQVCRDWGRLMSAAAFRAIDALLESGAKPARETTVPVLSFRRVAEV